MQTKFLKRPFLGQKGYTLVELGISMIMSGIVMVGLFVIVSGSHEHVIKLRKKINLQQDLSLIAYTLSLNIRQGLFGEQEIYDSYADYTSSGATQSSGSCLLLTFPSGDTTILYRENMDFKIEKSGVTTALVPDVVDSLLFTEGTKSIQTYLSVTQDSKSIASTFVDAFRNRGPTYETLRPMGAGTYTELASSPSATPNWECVDEAAADAHATYVRGGNSSGWETDTYATEDGSGTGTVDSVRIYICVIDASASSSTQTVLRVSGTDYYGPIISLGGISVYTNFFTTYVNNPNTSAPWTWTEIDAMEIGVRFRKNGRCTQVWAGVYYTE